jgi:DNA-directed RNA polymerase subunit RPC12/RpoP
MICDNCKKERDDVKALSFDIDLPVVNWCTYCTYKMVMKNERF